MAGARELYELCPFGSILGAGVRGRRRTADEGPLRPSILPANYLAEFIAGTFGPASSGRGLTAHLESEQRVRKVTTRTNLGVMAAQDLEESARRKLEDVNVTRAIKFKHTIGSILDHTRAARRDWHRPHLIREILSLDDSELAQQLAVRMADSRFFERLARESRRIPESPLAGLRRKATAEHFGDVEWRFRMELASFLPAFVRDEDGSRHEISDDKALKIINRIFDAIAPRMILIGHSQGGLVALRAMQLGMRRVRVRDSRRFLYSPRSGRAHRYSAVALAVGLAAPFDGVDRTPPDFAGGRNEPLNEASIPEFLKRLMPGVPQMLHGSAFLEALRTHFIPFDCSAISIANPEDGFVALERTRLPVGDFKNMHNLDVASTGAFDVIDMVPASIRPSFAFWPARQIRALLNENPRFEGLRQHCSYLFDLGVNWDVDNGEIVRRIFADDHGESLFDEMMYEVNFDGLREQLIASLLYRLRGSSPEERAHLAWMTPRLRQMIHDERLPFHNSIDKRASVALGYIEPQ